LPTGAVTFLFSDIEGATQLASTMRSDYSDLLKAHRSILRDAFGKHRGREIRAEGDAFFVVFASPKDAVAAAVERSGNFPRMTGPRRARPSADRSAHRRGLR
jgi:class 3 adenylate cyclase